MKTTEYVVTPWFNIIPRNKKNLQDMYDFEVTYYKPYEYTGKIEILPYRVYELSDEGGDMLGKYALTNGLEDNGEKLDAKGELLIFQADDAKTAEATAEEYCENLNKKIFKDYCKTIESINFPDYLEVELVKLNSGHVNLLYRVVVENKITDVITEKLILIPKEEKQYAVQKMNAALKKLIEESL